MTPHEEAGGRAEEAWYRRWFGAEYLALYPHRDRDEARRGVDLFLGSGGLPEGPVLDLACGAGRHLDAFADRDRKAVGLDLSAPLLDEAAEAHRGRVVRGDMRRLPFASGSFAGVASFFTSFGYFRDPADDRRTLTEASRVLRPRGAMLLDFLNAPQVRQDLVPEDEREIRGRRVRQRRRIRDGAVEKRIEILDGEGRPGSVFHERVRLYGPDALAGMLEEAGLRVEARYGNYRGEAYEPSSPRAILLARRARTGDHGSPRGERDR